MARSIQVSAFTAAPVTTDALKLVTSSLSGAELKSMDLSGPQKRAMLSFAGYDVQLLTSPGRIDLVIFKDGGPDEPTNKEIDAEDALSAFEAPFLSICAAETVNRLALIMGTAEPVASREAAVALVAEKLGIANLPVGINELEGRFNQPIDLNGVHYNRNLSWNVAEATIMVGSFMVNGAPVSLQQQRSQVLVGQQVDVNTSPHFVLPAGTIPTTYRDMRELALPLIGQGLATFNG